MTTTATQHLAHVQTLSDVYDPDEFIPRNSPPLLTPHRPKLQPSPSPPPVLPLAQVSPASSLGRKSSNHRLKVRPSHGDAVLVSFLDNGRRPEIAIEAESRALPSDDEYTEEESSDSPHSCSLQNMSLDTSLVVEPHSFDLKVLAAGALAFNANQVDPSTTIAASAVGGHADDRPHEQRRGSPNPLKNRELPIRDERAILGAPATSYPSREVFQPHQQTPVFPRKLELKSPTTVLPANHGELPPLQIISPKLDVNGRGPLPSIRAQLGDFKRLAESVIPSENEITGRHGSSFPRSPPTGLPRLSSMPSISGANHVSPPMSPNDSYRREPISPASSHATSPYYYAVNGTHTRPSAEYSSSATETPNTDQDQSTSTPATSVAERMSIDGLTTSQSGAYVCNFAGCTASPFQTQYLLNSHANVHSSARPHYCSVQGCPRSEGGKGFKRKNEMIRHGLVHDSPGYVCPFCPDREHKYPRPDNLQRLDQLKHNYPHFIEVNTLT
jgi:hypothetical protein